MRIAAIAVTVALAAPAAFAQDPPVPWVRLNVVTVRPDMVQEFIAVQSAFSERAKKTGVKWRTVSRTESFGDTYRFLIAAPLENLASLDQQPAADAEQTALVSRVQRCITGRTSYAVRTMPRISNPLPDGKAPDLMVVNMAEVAPGKEQAYIDIMADDFLPHFDEAEIHHMTGSLTFGGLSGFIHVFYVDNFAELDKGSPVMRELGADGAQAVVNKFAGVVTSNELWIARTIPEVSYGETQETDEP